MAMKEGSVVSVDGVKGEAVAGSVRLTATEQKKEVNLFLRWWQKTNASKWPTPRLGMEYIDELVDVSLLVNDFYLTDAMAQAAQNTTLAAEAQELKVRIHTATAERIAAYLALAVSGELRHAPIKAKTKGQPIKKWCESCANYHTEEALSVTTEYPVIKTLAERFGVQRGGDRRLAQQATVERLKSAPVTEQIEFLRLAVEAFELPVWGQSLGGPKWAQIARAGLNFLSGELNHSVFVDHAFDLQHNNGRVFDKRRNMITAHEWSVQSQLNTKKTTTAVGELRRRLDESYRFWSPEVEKLYNRGIQLGLWQAEQKKGGRYAY